MFQNTQMPTACQAIGLARQLQKAHRNGDGRQMAAQVYKTTSYAPNERRDGI